MTTSCMQFEDRFQPYHPGLPSIAQAQVNYEEFLSDHIPILADMGDIKLASWNVMESDFANGVAPKGSPSFGETPEQRQARYERIADAVAKILKEQQPDFFTLQEITAYVPGSDDSEGLWPVIYKRLENTSYEPAKYQDNVIDTSGNITLYNRDKFTLNLKDTPVQNQMPGKLQKTLSQLGAHGLVFERNNESSEAARRIRVCNVHAAYNDNPANHEKMINEFLNEGEENDTSIVIGDFNCMFDTLHNNPQITTTSLTPNIFRNHEMQGACAIDGAFAKKGNEPSAQLPSKHIDPKTGKVYEPAALDILDDKDKPNSQIEEESRFRPVMCLSKKPLAELENLLKALIGSETVSIMPAINLKNQHGLAIQFPNNMEDYFAKAGLSSYNLNNQYTGATSKVVYLPIGNAEETLRVPEILKKHFMKAYYNKLQQDKMAYCGIFSYFRISHVTQNMSLADIIKHAQSADNRSRSVCKELGWLKQDGSINNNGALLNCIREIIQLQTKQVASAAGFGKRSIMPKFKRILYRLQNEKLTNAWEKEPKTIPEIKELRISDLEAENPEDPDEKQIYGGFIVMDNADYDEIPVDEGKWILDYPKGDESINEAWKKAVELILKDKKVHQVKASAKSSKFPNQVLMIYTKNTHEDINRVYNLLREKGLLTEHMRYVRERDTLKNQESELFSHIPEQLVLMEVLKKFKDHKYELNGGGKKINGKKYSASAGKFLKKIEDLLNEQWDNKKPGDYEHLVEKTNMLIKTIQEELTPKTKPTKGYTIFLGLGARKQSTADLYKDILNTLDKSPDLPRESKQRCGTPAGD